MTVQIHVDGRVAQGRLAAFAAGLERYLGYARDHGYTVPRVLQGLSGPMNSIRLVYTYDDLAAYEEHEARTLQDAGYAAAASAMALVEGTITYSLFRGWNRPALTPADDRNQSDSGMLAPRKARRAQQACFRESSQYVIMGTARRAAVRTRSWFVARGSMAGPKTLDGSSTSSGSADA
jgi:hypothetical protein